MTDDAIAEIRRMNRNNRFAILALFAIGGGWAVFAPLDSAVVARGVVGVESNQKRIQHPSGGVVSSIYVKDGDRVSAGQTLFALDETQWRASLRVLTNQWIWLKAREARMIAERDGRGQFDVPAELSTVRDDPATAQAMESERSLLISRRAAQDGLVRQLKERLAQTSREHRALLELAQGRARERTYLGKELGGIEHLYKKGLATTNRLVSLQRDMTRLKADQVQLQSDAERTMSRSGEIELEILRRASERQTELADALRDVQSRIAEVEEKRIAALDSLERAVVRAPQPGVVIGSVLHTVGGVISPGETAMRLVPEGDNLVIEARVTPREIDRIALGGEASVKLLAGNQRTASQLSGQVIHIGADQSRDERTGESYFLVRIGLDRGAARRLAGVGLQPGMMAEAFIGAGERTPMEYILQPVSDQFARSMRER
jgi:HlyD family secretion protein